MLKLALNLVALVVAVSLGRHLGLGFLLTSVLVVVAAIFVHLAWERLFGLGDATSFAIRDDPLILEALQRAKNEWPRFLELFKERPEHCVIKFRLETSHGIENVWGGVRALEGDVVRLHLQTPPHGEVEIPDPSNMSVPLADVIDWQVMLDDESLIGGYTQLATFRILQRDHGELPPRYAGQLERYRDDGGGGQP